MKTIHKKVVVYDRGKPMEVIIPWEEYCEIAELLGVDLDQEAQEDLESGRRARVTGSMDEYIDLDQV